ESLARSREEFAMMRILVISVLAVLAGCASRPDSLPTQSGVELSRYEGTWYELARLPNPFQKHCEGDVRANYALQADGPIAVTNQCRQEDGTTKVANGVGRLAGPADEQDPARLEVRFAPQWTAWLPMVWGDYWIIRLHDGYQYSLVGTPDRKY